MKKNKLVFDSAFILAANVITLLSDMVSTRIASSIYSLSEYGFHSQIMLTSSIAVSLLSLGISNSANYYIPQLKGKEEKDKFLINLYALCGFICAAVVILIAVFFPNIVQYYEAPALYNNRWVVIFLPAVRITYSLYSGIMISQGKAIKSTILNAVRAFTIILVPVSAYYLKYNIYTFVNVSFFTEVAFCLYTMGSAMPLKKVVLKSVSYGYVKDILIFTVPLGVASLMSTLNLEIGKLFVSRALSVEDLGLYTNVAKELPMVAISGAFIAIIMPHVVKLVSEHEERRAVALWAKVIEFSYIILSVAVGICFVFSKEAITLLYSKKFLAGDMVFKVYVILQLIRVTYFGLLLRAKGKNLLILLCSVITIVLNILLNFVFFGFMGMMGLAVATMLSVVTMSVAQLAMTAKVLKMKFSEVFPFKEYGMITFIQIIFSTVFFFIKQLLFPNGEILPLWHTALICIVWLAAYVLVMRKRAINCYNCISTTQIAKFE